MTEEKDIKQCLAWIKENAADALLEEFASPGINKAGILPIYKQKVLLIKPKEKKKHLGAVPWQLIKGTRMFQSKDKWQDYDDLSRPPEAKTLEPLLCTALREGIEEAGLILKNIAFVGLLGDHAYQSTTTGKEKIMQLFAVGIEDKKAFHWPDKKHPVTDVMEWFDAGNLPSDTREDAVAVIQQLTAEWQD